jgi:hypothetical protein
MSESARGLDDDRLKRLVRDLEAIVRRELPWYDGNQHDPSIALVELLAFLGDTLAEYQSRLADDAYLETRPRLLVTVDASPWREVASLESSGPGDRVYVVDRGADGSATVRFGDGRHGAIPSAGARVAATYGTGTGAGGNGAVVTVRWPPVPPVALEISAGPGGISFAPPRRSWRDCLARLFGGRR